MISSAVGVVARCALSLLAVASLGLVVGPVANADNPLDGQGFYVNPNSAAMRAASADPAVAAIANTPQAYWMDNVSSPSVDAKYISAAQASGSAPILALYAVPHRDCGSFAAGGFGSADAYRGWIDGVAAAVGSGPAVIILEPDALAMADCLSADQRQERFGLMRYAVDTLTRNPATALYVDGGHSRWVSADVMAARLNEVGVGKARGFSLNTANFFTTDEEIGYGEAISGMTNGAHYVIDTSRNGAGPAAGDMYWCNPSGRALGATPTTATGNGNVDAFLWVKRPGESDGSCDKGDPRAGTFVNQFAIDLARNAGR
ncbi:MULTISPECIES: glycoside hydrolase family 6 protein [unclassified Mycobacteroides]|uniref:glycoside hydrolase family 6 protein n=1 Tax=unclassified Mycobacteroides TaxID=2618759 RepID=UPI0013969D9C